MNCQKCGQQTFLPFQCPYCGGKFCSNHRLPENHSCSKIEQARIEKSSTETYSPSSYEYSVTIGTPNLKKRGLYFSPKEIRHLVIAAAIVMGIGLSSMLFYSTQNWWIGLAVFGVYGLVLMVSFLAHELAHKFSAQKLGLWAEFRLVLWGTFITLLSMISPVFKIISPGAVMISGSADPREMGKVSLSGPLTNIILSAVLTGFAFIPSSYSGVLFSAAFINGFMALFNLIPFGILDGFKVFQWDKKVWAIAFAASAVLMIINYYYF